MRIFISIFQGEKGFILIELIIASIVSFFILIVAGFIYTYFMDTWNQGVSDLELQREGTYAIEEMAKAIRAGSCFEIGKYGENDPEDSMIIIEKKTKFYQDTSTTSHCLKKENDGIVTIIVPDIADITKTSIDRHVNSLLFTRETSSRVRIDLVLKAKKEEYESTTNSTSTIHLRN